LGNSALYEESQSLIFREGKTFTFKKKEAMMFRFLIIPLLAIGLFVFLAAQPLAEDQSQPIIVKVYKSPG